MFFFKSVRKMTVYAGPKKNSEQVQVELGRPCVSLKQVQYTLLKIRWPSNRPGFRLDQEALTCHFYPFLRNLREVVVQQMDDVKNSLLGSDGDKDDSPESRGRYHWKFERECFFSKALLKTTLGFSGLAGSYTFWNHRGIPLTRGQGALDFPCLSLYYVLYTYWCVPQCACMQCFYATKTLSMDAHMWFCEFWAEVFQISGLHRFTQFHTCCSTCT